MEERRNLFNSLKEVCEENDRLHEQNTWLKKETNVYKKK